MTALAALALGLLTLTSNATAQSLDQQWTYCENDNNAYAADLQIGGCTSVIQSGRETQNNVAIAFYGRGNAYYDQHDYVRAIADYTQAIQLNPQHAQIFYNRGVVYGAQGDYTEAISDYTQAIRLDPRYASAFYNRGNAYNNGPQPDYTHAIADYDQAALIDASNVVYQNARCWTRALANRELDIARTACDAALGLAPKGYGVLDSRGMVGLKQGRWQDAWNDYDTAVQFDANYASAIFGRGIAALRLGRAADGQADIARATLLDAKIALTYAQRGLTP